MKKKKYIIPIVAALCLALASTAAFSWFFVNNSTPMSFEMLEIRSKVTLYRGNDINSNGVPDLAESPVKMGYYTEKYDFEYLAGDSAMTEEKTADILLNIDIADIAPTQTRTFKLSLENTGAVDNLVSLSFDISGLDDDEKAFLGLMSVTAMKVIKDGDSGDYRLEECGKFFFSDAEGGVIDGIFSDNLPGTVSADSDGSDVYMDFWLRFYMEPLDRVNLRRAASGQAELTEDEYNAYAGRSAENIRFFVCFDVAD